MTTPAKSIHIDQRFLEGLIRNDVAVVKEIYDRFARKIKLYILQNNGNEEDGADIMQESLLDIYRMANDRKLELTCPFEAFLLMVCKRKWLNELKKRHRKPVTKMPDDLSDLRDPDAETRAQWDLYDQRKALFTEMFNRLSSKCKEVIEKSISADSLELLAQQMGVSYGYLRKKKSECMGTLISLIKQNNKYA